MKLSPLPWAVQPCAQDHGQSTVIVDAKGFVLARIPNSAAWDDEATLRHPEDRDNARAMAAAGPTRAALEAAEHWLAEEAASPHPGQTRPDEILRVIREALGKPHDAPDAAPRPTIQDYRAALDALIPLAHDRAADMSEIADEDGEDGNHDDAKAAWEAVEAARALMAGHAPDAAPAAPVAPDASALMLAALKSLFQHHPSAFVVSCGLPLTPELAAKPDIMALQAALVAIRAGEGREG